VQVIVLSLSEDIIQNGLLAILHWSNHLGSAAGQRQDLGLHLLLRSTVLGKLLNCWEICKHVPGRERIRSMRYLYTMLQWASQRGAEVVRTRAEHTHPTCEHVYAQRVQQLWQLVSLPYVTDLC